MRLARSTGAVSGLLIVLLGIWGALVPFVGPYFDYSFGTNSTWHYTTDRLWLDILPGVTAVVGGLLIFFAATRVAGAVGGWLAVLAGAWFAVGPAVSLTWEGAIGPIGPPLYGWGITRACGRFTRRVTANLLRAFADGPAASRHPARDNLQVTHEWAGDPIAAGHDLWPPVQP